MMRRAAVLWTALLVGAILVASQWISPSANPEKTMDLVLSIVEERWKTTVETTDCYFFAKGMVLKTKEGPDSGEPADTDLAFRAGDCIASIEKEAGINESQKTDVEWQWNGKWGKSVAEILEKLKYRAFWQWDPWEAKRR